MAQNMKGYSPGPPGCVLPAALLLLATNYPNFSAL